MPYTNSIPFATQRFKDSEPLIRDNFVEIQNALIVNHGDFGTPEEGKHEKVTMPVQAASPPGGAFVAGETGFYNFLNPSSAVNEIYINKSNGNQVPLTASLQAAIGWMFLPSGLVVKWKNQSVPNIGDNPVNFLDAPARFSSIIHVQLTINGVVGPPGFIYVNGSDLAPAQQTITVNCSVTGMSVNTLVIGVPV